MLIDLNDHCTLQSQTFNLDKSNLFMKINIQEADSAHQSQLRQAQKIFKSPEQLETPLHMAWFNPNYQLNHSV